MKAVAGGQAVARRPPGGRRPSEARQTEPAPSSVRRERDDGTARARDGCHRRARRHLETCRRNRVLGRRRTRPAARAAHGPGSGGTCPRAPHRRGAAARSSPMCGKPSTPGHRRAALAARCQGLRRYDTGVRRQFRLGRRARSRELIAHYAARGRPISRLLAAVNAAAIAAASLRAGDAGAGRSVVAPCGHLPRSGRRVTRTDDARPRETRRGLLPETSLGHSFAADTVRAAR